MCDACFNSEIRSFHSRKDFEDFDLLLTQKIANTLTMRMDQFVNTEWKDIGYQVYECLKCGQLWRLRKPDVKQSGYFLKVTRETVYSDTTPFFKRKRFKRGFIFFIVLALIIAVLLWLA
jgi:hypothetical protein